MNKEALLKMCPKIKEMIENNQSKPTEEERIVALENAIADLAVMLVGGVNND